jgi:hypothetical protein
MCETPEVMFRKEVAWRSGISQCPQLRPVFRRGAGIGCVRSVRADGFTKGGNIAGPVCPLRFGPVKPGTALDRLNQGRL